MRSGKNVEWTESTWNPVTGCTKISDGCKNCYAAVMAQRLKLMGNKKYVNGFEVTLHEYCLNDRLKWKKPSLIFVNSMSDLFHEDIPLEFIQKIFGIMNTGCYAGNRCQMIPRPLLEINLLENDCQNEACLGLADFQSHYGSAPISIVWKMKESLPGFVLKKTVKV